MKVVNSNINWLALFVLAIATAFNAYWIWGLLFIFWAIKSLWNPVTILITPVQKVTSPVLFWAINIIWLIFGVWYLAYDLLWRIEIYSIFGFNLYPSLG